MTTRTTKRIGIVTGGTRGIGRGISERLASWLDILVLTYNTDVERANQVATELRRQYSTTDVYLVAGDLSEEASRNAIFECVDRILDQEPDSHLQGECDFKNKSSRQARPVASPILWEERRARGWVNMTMTTRTATNKR